MAKVTGIGGIFFKSKKDPRQLAKWYCENLGLTLEPWGGSILKWTDDKAEDGGMTVWNIASSTTELFSPSESTFMINYRVDNLEALLSDLRAKGIETIKDTEHHENGSFAWILDPEGNKIELWEPKIWDDKNKR